MKFTIEMMSGAKVEIDGTVKVGDSGELKTTSGDQVTVYGPAAWFSVSYAKGARSAVLV